jgi:hypothetical protein
MATPPFYLILQMHILYTDGGSDGSRASGGDGGGSRIPWP